MSAVIFKNISCATKTIRSLSTFHHHQQKLSSQFCLMNSAKHYQKIITHPLNHQFSMNLHSVRYFSNTEEPTSEVPSFYDRYIFPEPPDMISEEEHNIVADKVAECVTSKDRGRLFAVVVVANKQFKVTDNDLIQIPGGMVGVDVGDRIRLERVLLVGGRDFTMIGRPLLRRSLVKIEATVVEKTPGVEKIIQRFRPRKSFERKHIYTPYYTVIRINSVQAYPDVS